jgi:hypothetical protein
MLDKCTDLVLQGARQFRFWHRPHGGDEQVRAVYTIDTRSKEDTSQLYPKQQKRLNSSAQDDCVGHKQCSAKVAHNMFGTYDRLDMYHRYAAQFGPCLSMFSWNDWMRVCACAS